MLTQERLEQRFNRPLRYFDQVDSTNDAAKTWLEAGAPEGAVVIADEQTRGRGRKGRCWRTPPNEALALSIILKPDKALLPRLNMVAALSVYDLALQCGCVDVEIKWPNDILVNGLKVSGVLPEAVWEARQLRGAILGIGVNVRLDITRTQLRHSAVSLEDVINRRLDRVELIAMLLSRIDFWYRRIELPSLVETWKDRLNTLNQVVAVDGVVGVAVDVSADGALLIRDETGSIHQSGAGDLVVLSTTESR